MSDTTPVTDLWARVTACLAEHAGRLQLREGASEAAIAEAEQAMGIELPADYKAWLRLHDGEEEVEGRLEWLPAFGRLLPIAVTVERWRDEQDWAEPDDDGLNYLDDDDRIRRVITHAKRIVIAGNAYGDGDNMYLDLIPGPAGAVGQVIVAITECDFEVIGTSFTDFLRRWVTAFEAGRLTIDATQDPPRVDRAEKDNPWDRWEAVLRAV